MPKMKSSALLKRAKEFVESGQMVHVCPSVHRAAAEASMTEEGRKSCSENMRKASEIRRRLTELMDGCRSLNQWLKEKHGIQPKFEDDFYKVKMRHTRVAWINHLIQEYEQAGD